MLPNLLKRKRTLAVVGFVGVSVGVLLAIGLAHSHGRSPTKTSTAASSKIKAPEVTKAKTSQSSSEDRVIVGDVSKPKVDKDSSNSAKSSTVSSTSDETASANAPAQGTVTGSLSGGDTVAADNPTSTSTTLSDASNPTAVAAAGGYTDEVVAEQAKQFDTDPAYLKDPAYLNNIAPLQIGDNFFTAAAKQSLMMYNKTTTVDYTFKLSSPSDWAMFKGQVNLSDDDYAKVVKYYNTTQKYIEDNHIEIIGTGG